MFDCRKCNSKNNDKCGCVFKNLKEHNVCEKDYIWNPARCSCENDRYLANIIDDSVITCDENLNAVDSVSTNVPANALSTLSENATSTASINFRNENVRYKIVCYILYTVC